MIHLISNCVFKEIKNCSKEKKEQIRNRIIEFLNNYEEKNYHFLNKNHSFDSKNFKGINGKNKIFKFRANNDGDRIIFMYAKDAEIDREGVDKNSLIILNYSNHEEQGRKARKIKAEKIKRKKIINNSGIEHIKLKTNKISVISDEYEIKNLFENFTGNKLYEADDCEDISNIFKRESEDKRKTYQILDTKQYNVVMNTEQKPLFVFGSAGSGKTTAAIGKIRKMKKHDSDFKNFKIGYFTYADRLKEAVENELEEQFKKNVDFCVVNDYIKEKSGYIEELEYKEFKNWYKMQGYSKDLNINDVWNKINNIKKIKIAEIEKRKFYGINFDKYLAESSQYKKLKEIIEKKSYINKKENLVFNYKDIASIKKEIDDALENIEEEKVLEVYFQFFDKLEKLERAKLKNISKEIYLENCVDFSDKITEEKIFEIYQDYKKHLKNKEETENFNKFKQWFKNDGNLNKQLKEVKKNIKSHKKDLNPEEIWKEFQDVLMKLTAVEITKEELYKNNLNESDEKILCKKLRKIIEEKAYINEDGNMVFSNTELEEIINFINQEKAYLNREDKKTYKNTAELLRKKLDRALKKKKPDCLSEEMYVENKNNYSKLNDIEIRQNVYSIFLEYKKTRPSKNTDNVIVDFDIFKNWFYGKEELQQEKEYYKLDRKLTKGLNPAEVWREIQGIIKGMISVQEIEVILSREEIFGKDADRNLSEYTEENSYKRLFEFISERAEINDSIIFNGSCLGENIKSINEKIQQLKWKNAYEELKLYENLLNKIREKFNQQITENDCMTKQKYISIGKDYSMIEDSETKERIYEIFSKYKEYFKDRKDENDLARMALKNCEKIYDYVICDEIQDLTEIQIYYLLSSVKKHYNLMLLGDYNQTVNPTFFDSSHVEAVYKTVWGVDESASDSSQEFLNINHRSSKAIVKFANALNSLKLRALPISDKYVANEENNNNIEGKLFLVDIKEKDYEFILNLKNERAYTDIIVVSEEKKKKFQEKGFDDIWTIAEYKGCENRCILGIDILSDLKNELEKIAEAAMSNNKLGVKYRLYFNWIYVFVTRACKNGYFFEEDVPEEFIKNFSDVIYKYEEEILNAVKLDMAEKSSVEEHIDKAEELEKQREYNKALIKYRNVLKKHQDLEFQSSELCKNLQKAIARCKGHIYKDSEEKSEAAKYFEEAEEFKTARDIYFEIENYKKALKCCAYTDMNWTEIKETYEDKDMWSIMDDLDKDTSELLEEKQLNFIDEDYTNNLKPVLQNIKNAMDKFVANAL